MTNNTLVADEYYQSSKLAKFSFEPYWPQKKLRICVTGAGGFIASHLAKRLKSEGHYVVASDWKRNEHMPEDMFCHEFHLVDLRVYDNCHKVVDGCDHVFNFAADMGGMGFIQSNHSVIMYNNTMISFNMLEASRKANIERFFLRLFRLHISRICTDGHRSRRRWSSGGHRMARATPRCVWSGKARH